MAASSARNSKNILCRYFASNACNKGADCPFSHDRNARADMVCKYYLLGSCSYGENCRYDHKRPPGMPRWSSETSSASSSSRPANESSKTKRVENSRVDDANTRSISISNSGFLRDTESASNSSFRKSTLFANAKSCNPESESSKFSADAVPFYPSWMRKSEISETTFASAAGSVPLRPLCPYFEEGFCDKGFGCQFVHGLLCEICNKACLHPADEQQCVQHRGQCEARRQAALEIAHAEERSTDKTCGICMENVWEKKSRFGILQRCKHCFCLDCIRKWRMNNNEFFEKETVRSCPECRIHSDFVVPARYWVEDSDDKEKLITQYREKNKQIQCKYVKGSDISGCPFGNKCFFKHELPDGTIAEGESPRMLRRTSRPHMSSFLFDEFDSDSDSETEFTHRLESALEMIYSMQLRL